MSNPSTIVPAAASPSSVSPGAPVIVRRKVPVTGPLRHARYRRIWLASVVSKLGTWIQTFASAWLVASLSGPAPITSMVQTATYVPIFCFPCSPGWWPARSTGPSSCSSATCYRKTPI